MTPAIKGTISILIFGNGNFPVLPAPFQCMVHTTLKDAEEYLRKTPVDVVYVNTSEPINFLSNSLLALAKIAPAVSLIAICEKFEEAELAISSGAADYILRDKLTADVAIERARFVISRAGYLKHEGGNNLYSYNDLAAIARVLSHDIRNALSGIVLSLEPIRQACGSNEDAKTYLGILERSATKLNEVVNRFSNATGNIALRMKDEDFNDLIRQTIAALPANYAQDAKIIQQYSAQQIVLPLDREKFSAALSGIIVNAFESFEGNGNGEINVTSAVTDDAAIVRIQDNGPGIDCTTLENIFRPFFTTRQSRVGLGLPLARSIVNAHGGTLHLESRNAVGTIVTLRFPVCKP